MRTRKPVGTGKAAAAIAAAMVVLPAGPAAAYIGPGAGLSAIGSLLALIAVLFLAVVGFVWYPVKRLIKGTAAKQTKEGESADA